MAVTEASLRKRIRALLYGGQPQARGYTDAVQNNPLTAGGTTLTVLDGTNWSEGDLVDFGDDGDIAVVTAIATNDLTIRRQEGATSHVQGTTIYKNPRFTTEQIDYAIERVLHDLFPDVWKITTISDTYAADEYWYPINNDQLTEILTVFYEDDEYLSPVPVAVWKQSSGLDSTDFTNKQGVYLPSAQGMDVGDTFYVVYREVIDAVDDLLDRQEPLVAHGAAYQLMVGANAARTHDPSRWTDRTVQPGQEGRDSVNFLREFMTLRRREELRLKQEEDRLPKNRLAQKARRFRV